MAGYAHFNYKADINWGDGTTTAGTITYIGPGFRIFGDYTYTRAGFYTITVTIHHETAEDRVVRGNVLVVAGAAASATTLQSLSGPTVFGQTAVFTATVSAASGTPTGYVTLADGADVLDFQPLVGGNATFTITSLLAGPMT